MHFMQLSIVDYGKNEYLLRIFQKFLKIYIAYKRSFESQYYLRTFKALDNYTIL